MYINLLKILFVFKYIKLMPMTLDAKSETLMFVIFVLTVDYVYSLNNIHYYS